MLLKALLESANQRAYAQPRVFATEQVPASRNFTAPYRSPRWRMYQVILEAGIGQFREFEPRRVHTRINSLGLFLVHKLTCGKRESVS